MQQGGGKSDNAMGSRRGKIEEEKKESREIKKRQRRKKKFKKMIQRIVKK